MSITKQTFEDLYMKYDQMLDEHLSLGAPDESINVIEDFIEDIEELIESLNFDKDTFEELYSKYDEVRDELYEDEVSDEVMITIEDVIEEIEELIYEVS